MSELGSIHAIIRVFDRVLGRLEVTPAPAKLESLGLLVNQAMAGKSRLFHSHEHILELSRGADPLQTLAALFHDFVYVQVDQGLPRNVEATLAGYCRPDGAAWRVLPVDRKKDLAAHVVLSVFDFKPGDALSVHGGLNEFLSALVAARELSPLLKLGEITQIVAFIEGTIPFRLADAQGRTALERLATRLTALDRELKLGLDVEETVRRTVWMANRDVGNFSDRDPGRFLDNTWKLLPESNAALAAGGYTVREYRTALQKMEGFLGRLRADSVYHAFRGVPDARTLARLEARTTRNLQVSVRYLQVKLFTISLLEALAGATGGDAPLALFTGGLVDSSGTRPRRIEDFLPQALPRGAKADVLVMRLLEEGRATETSFDLRNSPIAAWLYRSLGDQGIANGLIPARRMFEGKISAHELLAAQDPGMVSSLARSAARLVITRRRALEQLGRGFAAAERESA